MEQVFPFTIGANIGTTVTAMLAALSTGNAAAISVAFAHMLFNVTGSVLIYLPPPVRKIPLAMARTMGRIASRRRIIAGIYILVFFYGIPLLLLFLTGALG